MEKKREQTAWLGGSILDRNTRSPNNPNAMITLPANYIIDTSTAPLTNGAPASFDVPVIQLNNGEAASGAFKYDENDNERSMSSSLLVPDRVSMEYKDDEDETEAQVASTSSSAGISIAVPVIAVSSEAATSVTILLSKKRTSLGGLLLVLFHYSPPSTARFLLSTPPPPPFLFPVPPPPAPYGITKDC